MSLVNTIRELLQPLTHDEQSPWFITEEELDGVPTKVFANRPANLRELFEMAAKDFGDRDFIIYEDERLSFREAWEKASALAKCLSEDYGIQKGDRVAIAMRNYPEWALGLMAISSIGGIAVLMNAWWVTRELEYGLKDSGAKVILCDRERMERLKPLHSSIDFRGLSARVENPPEGVLDIQEAIAKYQGQPAPACDIDGEDPLWLAYTSGTTGFPKGAQVNHRSVISALQCFQFTSAAAASLDPELAKKAEAIEQECTLLTVPLFHVTGAVPLFLLSFLLGRKLVMMYRWDAETALQLIEREKATSFTGVPTMAYELVQHPNFDRYDTSSLLTIGGGGAPTPPEQVRKVESKFAGRPGGGYGLTETNAVTATNVGDLYLQRPRSTGIPAILVDLDIRDEKSGKSLPANAVGEVCIKGAVLFQGYWNKPEATAECLSDGWFRSGDLGRLDEDGFLYIEDRAKDMVLRGGENVYCAEVEAAIYEVDGIVEAAAFGLPDDRLGERVAAAVRLREDSDLDQTRIQAALVDKLAKFKIPDFILCQTTPLTRGATGKIQKRDIRDALIAEQASS